MTAFPQTAEDVQWLLSQGVQPLDVPEHFALSREALLRRLARAGRKDLVQRLRIEERW